MTRMQRRDLAKLGFAFTGLAGGLTALTAPARAAEAPATGYASVLEPVFKRLLEEDVPERTSLDDRLANLLQTAAMTVLPAHGGSEALAETFRRALFAGVSAEELLEVLVQTMPVAGMPAVISAERILHAELAEAGMSAPATEPSTAGAAERFERGLAVEEKLFGREYLYAFHAGLREDERPLQLSLLSSWAYGETFGRAHLTDSERELVLLASLIASDAREEVEMHVRAAKTLGATRTDLIGLLTVLLPYTGFPKVRAGLALINAVEAEDERRRAIAEAREEALKRLEAKREAKREAEEKAKAKEEAKAESAAAAAGEETNPKETSEASEATEPKEATDETDAGDATDEKPESEKTSDEKTEPSSDESEENVPEEGSESGTQESEEPEAEEAESDADSNADSNANTKGADLPEVPEEPATESAPSAQHAEPAKASPTSSTSTTTATSNAPSSPSSASSPSASSAPSTSAPSAPSAPAPGAKDSAKLVSDWSEADEEAFNRAIEKLSKATEAGDDAAAAAALKELDALGASGGDLPVLSTTP